MLYRVRVQGLNQNGEPWTRSLIYKCLPDNPTRRQAFKSDVLFRNEVAFYTQALPVLLQFQVPQYLFHWQPKCGYFSVWLFFYVTILKKALETIYFFQFEYVDKLHENK
jgi:hypothetical protein